MGFPKILIIGETFRLNGGGGITMINLFRDWPSEKIGIITDRISETDIHTTYCYYQLGDDEIKLPFPFNLLQKRIMSGEYHFPNAGQVAEETTVDLGRFKTLRQKARRLLDIILKKTGLSAYFYRIKISNRLREWIIDFNPDLIYVQPFLHRIMRFGNLLYRELGIPYAVHIMDDSVSFLNKSMVFRNRLQRLIDRDFCELMKNADVHMCISESMSSEYKSRYGKTFQVFRNPIETERWLPYQKNDLKVNRTGLKIIYTGRLFSPTYSSLVDMSHVIDGFNKNGINVFMDIFTYDANTNFSDTIANLSGITLKKPVTVTEMPGLVTQYDIFFLCLDFDDYSRKYSQYSISTRTSEGMISGVPILMYGPASSAQHKYLKETKSAYLVSERSSDLLVSAVNDLWNKLKLREEISLNAVSTANNDNNALMVREKFRQALSIRLKSNNVLP